MEPTCVPKASPERSENGPRLGSRPAAVLENKKLNDAAGRRNGGGLWGGKSGGLKPCKELSHLSPTRPSARWAGGFKTLRVHRPPIPVLAGRDEDGAKTG